MRAVGYICQPEMAQTKRCVRGSFNQSLHIPDKSLGAKETEELEMLVFLADRQPTAYALAYKDEEEVIAEFRRKLGKFLPDDFNYGARIGYFQSCVPFY